ncbi:MAG: hypothetical protein M3Z25_14125 [Actinomycetota bacterium]|nr:hypothetical protein [Actinomycetota bacterium]
MMSTWLAAAIAIAAIAATYFFCIRPHLRGQGCGAAGSTSAQDAELDRQLGELREELRVLHAQDRLDSGQVPSGTHTPPRDA